MNISPTKLAARMLMVGGLVFGFVTADLFAQSGGGSSRRPSASRGFPSPGANRPANGLRLGPNSINSFVTRGQTAGTAAADIRTDNNRSGLGSLNRSSQSNPFRAPQRARAASFGTVSSRQAVKPFTGATTSPTSSPYLGLFDINLDGDSVAFNQRVQPALQQQAANRQLQRQQQQQIRLQQQQSQEDAAINIQLQQILARPTFNPSGSQRTPPTGHPAVFGNTSRYFGGRR